MKTVINQTDAIASGGLDNIVGYVLLNLILQLGITQLMPLEA